MILKQRLKKEFKNYSKLMKYYCFVQARYSSKRLKGKVLKNLVGIHY